eukprot:scaffold1387_cov260-Pinguiococcus_pyrenoidosus.AAC.17
MPSRPCTERLLHAGKWPPSEAQWPPAGGIPDGSPSEPALVLCAFSHVFWYPNPSEPSAAEGFLSDKMTEKRCVASGMTVHQFRTDAIASYLVSGASRVTCFQRSAHQTCNCFGSGATT